METPTISKKQQKKALSAKKSKKETIKNVLVQPYDNYWPLLSPEDNHALKEILEKWLPRVRNEKISVPYQEIKTVPKEERSKFRETFNRPNFTPINKSESSHLIFGVNSVTVLLEKHEVSSILIASDPTPRLLVQHVLDLSVLYKIPILVVSGLREILRKCCGFSSVIIGLKTGFQSESKLDLIHQSILNIHENYPPSNNHIQSHRQINSQPGNVIEIESDTETVNGVGKTNFQSAQDVSVNETNVSDKETSVIEIDSDMEIVEAASSGVCRTYHLIRDSKNVRVFDPSVAKRKKTDVNNGEFLPLLAQPVGTQLATNYRALRVQRLKGDKNRNQRKMFGSKTKRNN